MKNYQEFITEVNKNRDNKLKGRLKELEQKYQQEYNDRYMKPFQNKQVKTAQLAPLEKENQLPGKYSDVFIRTVDSSMDKLRGRAERYGNIRSLKDIHPKYP